MGLFGPNFLLVAANGLRTTEEKMVDTDETARLLGLATNTVEKMRVTGTGPRFVKLGRAVRYRLTDIEAYIAERVVESTSDQGRV